MRKTKILALILVLSLMITGTAYALWNQHITLSTTAAMGEMNLAVVCDPMVYPLSSMKGLPGGTREDYMDPIKGDVTSNAQGILVTVGDMYPGAKYGLNYTIRNTGDVPFELKDATISFAGGNYALFTKLTGGFQFLYQPANNGAPQVIRVTDSLLSAANFGQAVVSACNGLVIYPGDELRGWGAYQDMATTFMQVSVDSGISGDDFERESTSFTVNFNWQQCTPTQVNAITEN